MSPNKAKRLYSEKKNLLISLLKHVDTLLDSGGLSVSDVAIGMSSEYFKRASELRIKLIGLIFDENLISRLPILLSAAPILAEIVLVDLGLLP